MPYIGEAAGVRALLAGEIGIMTLTAGTAGPLIKVGRVFPLAIYAASRDERFSQVPTIGEITGDYTLALPGWLALVAKPGTPAPVTKLLREVTAKCARSDPQYRLRLVQMNASPVDLCSERRADVVKPLHRSIQATDRATADRRVTKIGRGPRREYAADLTVDDRFQRISRLTAFGRLPELTRGRFVDANREGQG